MVEPVEPHPLEAQGAQVERAQQVAMVVQGLLLAAVAVALAEEVAAAQAG